MEEEEKTVMVELDIFSGRQNPSWILSSNQIEDLKKMLQEIPSVESKLHRISKLGYRGFYIINIAKIPELPEKIRVYNQLVSIIEKKTILHYKDANGIEQWLFQQSRDQGYGELIDKDMEKA